MLKYRYTRNPMHLLKKFIAGSYIIPLVFVFSIATEAGTTPASDQLCLTDVSGQEQCYTRAQVQAEFDRVQEDPNDPDNVCLEPTAGELHCYSYANVRQLLSTVSSGTGTTTPSSSGGVDRGGGQSGTVETPAFRDPVSVFLGPFTGPDTAPLQGSYTAPLLQVADRQVAFQILINFFLSVIGVVAVLYLVTNGYRYVMARGDEAQMTQAKKGITFAIIGLLFVLGAYTIVATILNFGARPPVTTGVGIGVGVSF